MAKMFLETKMWVKNAAKYFSRPKIYEKVTPIRYYKVQLGVGMMHNAQCTMLQWQLLSLSQNAFCKYLNASSRSSPVIASPSVLLVHQICPSEWPERENIHRGPEKKSESKYIPTVNNPIWENSNTYRLNGENSPTLIWRRSEGIKRRRDTIRPVLIIFHVLCRNSYHSVSRMNEL